MRIEIELPGLDYTGAAADYLAAVRTVRAGDALDLRIIPRQSGGASIAIRDGDGIDVADHQDRAEIYDALDEVAQADVEGN